MNESLPDVPTETHEYISISDRVQQDVWHDNFVPRYSAIASADANFLMVIGVWMIFGSNIFFTVLSMFVHQRKPFRDFPSIYLEVSSWLFCLLSIAILFVQTRRFLLAKKVKRLGDQDAHANNDVHPSD